LLAATSAGVYYLDSNDLSYRYFFDTEGALTTLTVSKDGTWIATGDDKGTVAVWNVLDGKRLYRLEGTAQRIELLELSPDKSKLAFTDSNNRIHLWNLRQDLHYPFERKHLLRINRIAFTADGNTLLSGGDDFKIYIWDVSSGDSKTSITADQKIIDFDLSSDDQYLAVSLNRSNATIQIWDWRAKAITNTITDARDVIPFSHIAYLPNGQNIVTGSADGIVRVWNALGTDKVWETPSADQDGNPIKRDPVDALSIAKSGTQFAVMFENGIVEIWDLALQSRKTSRDFRYEEIKRVVLSPDDRLVVFQGGDSFVEILSVANSAEYARIPGILPRGNPISPDSRMIAVKSGDLNLYTLSPTESTSLFTLYDFPINGSVNYTPDGNILTAYAGGILKYWSTSSGLELNPSLTRRESRCLIIFRRDDSFLSASSEIGVIYASDNLGPFCQITRGPRTTSEKFLPDGSIIALSSGNQVIQLWDQRTGGQRTEIESLAPGGILDAAISADGKLLAAASVGGTIEIYDLESHNLVKSLELKTGPIYHVAFSNDGKYVVTGSADGTVRFFGLQP
ncbi:MAG: WD40 repeat domain-containing protein, partial [Anaerolineales bacterium]|nr:WD40 repeat domain-containing protein [Anaerolineales bacterium]